MLSCRWMMSVVTVLRKSRSCDTTTRVFFQRVRYSSSHSTARRSRWLVGSSSSSRVGWMYRARAREMRMRQPPLNDCVARFCMASVNPRPCRILEARLSAVEAAIWFMRSYTSFRRSWALSWSQSGSSLWAVSGSSSFSLSSFSSALSSISSTSAATTASRADLLSPTTSCSTSSTSSVSGTGIWRRARRRSRVDLPRPLGPTRP
mmetsp:Transcript_25706/g.56008  ORF Transcript_25706/g.56008 Transcript_25706/m.56008 type:complete len:205 (+) Transcript_25706:1083-1697(+)